MSSDEERSNLKEESLISGKRKALIASDDEQDEKTSQKRKIDDDHEEGEVGSQSEPSSANDDTEDDEEDEEDEEMTEADRKFIVDDEEDGSDDDQNQSASDESDEESRRRRRKEKKKKKKSRNSEETRPSRDEEGEEDLSEDELDLIQENYGKKSKKLRRKGEKDELMGMFDDEVGSEDGEAEQAAVSRPRPDFDERELYQDDLDDFVVRDDSDDDAGGEDVNAEAIRAEKLRRKKERLEFARNLGTGYGISDDSWREIQELFGDGTDYDYALGDPEQPSTLFEGEVGEEEFGEDLQDQSVTVTRKTKEITLKDVYEPAELAEKMLTDIDEQIRMRDIPERFQLSSRIKEGNPDDAEIGKEAALLARQMRREKEKDNVTLEVLVTAITSVLKNLRRDFLEIPYIYAHRKDYFQGVLSLQDLWKVMQLNEQYLQLDQKKSSVRKMVRDLVEHDPSIREDTSLKSALEKMFGLDEAEDVIQYVQVHYVAAINKMQQESGNSEQIRKRGFRRPGWRQTIEDAVKHNMNEFSKLFNIREDLYVTSVVSQTPQHFPEDHFETPEVAASRFICPRFPNVESVLDATRTLLGHKLGTQPTLRSFLRRVYNTDATVTVQLTDKGKNEIDSTHPYYSFKYLTDKPVYKFVDGQFLQILAAEAEGFLRIIIRVEEEDRLLQDMIKNLCNTYVSDLSTAWNSQRAVIATIAAKQVLFPHCARWLKDKLGTAASEWVVSHCQVALEEKVNRAPFRPAKLAEDDYFDDEGAPIVVSISWGDGTRNDSAYAVVVNEDGVLSDFLELDKLTDRDRESDINTLVDFISNHRPDAIAIGGFKTNTLTILVKLAQDVAEKCRIREGWTTPIPVYMIEDEIARIFMNSKRGEKEFPSKDYPRMIPYCVSLARKVQDPTMEYASLCNVDNDIKHIRLHPLQHLLTEDQLLHAIEKAMLNMVNICGVDINAAVAYPHLSSTLQFVSGLGPRKAQAMIAKIHQMGGKLESRAELVRKQLVAQRLFLNCASFIRIRSRHFKKTYHSTLDVLDDTRIHPRDYDLARKMAADALDLDDVVFEEENPSAHVQELMEGDVEKLNLLMLDDYAVELEKRIKERKRICLNEIKEELMNPYGERRNPFIPATPNEVFTMLTGETSETLRVGMVLPAQVVRVKERFLVCEMASGIEGILSVKQLDLPFDQADVDLTTLYSPGITLDVRVIEINKERMSLELSGKSNEVTGKDIVAQFQVPKDPYFNNVKEKEDLAEHNVTIQKKKTRHVRVIKHSFFQNVDYKGAITYLENRPRGDLVIRPSTKGMDHISITWKVEDGVFQHIDVLELDKENDFSLGRILQIDGRRFTELDEIIAQHIEPMARKVTQFIQHPKYQRLTRDDMMNHVTEQANALKRSAYGFIIALNKPGCFYLVYKHPNTGPKYDLINVRPQSFDFRKKAFRNLDDLLNFFKTDEAQRAQDRAKMAKAAPSAPQQTRDGFPAQIPSRGPSVYPSIPPQRQQSDIYYRGNVPPPAGGYYPPYASQPPRRM